MTIKLPKPGEIIEPKEINPKYLLLYGSPKVGKTEIISSLGNSYLLIEIDPHGAAFFKGTYIEVNNYHELNEVMDNIKAANCPYKYVIIDTITKFANWMEEYATEMYKSSNLGKNFKGENVVVELAKGAGYLWLRRAFAIWFEEMKTLADRVIFLGHLKDAALTSTTMDELGNKITVEKIGIDEVSTTDLDLTGKLKQIICAEVDAIGYIYGKTTLDKESKKPIRQLRVNFNSGTSVLGGARPIHLRGRDMILDWREIYLEEK